METRHESTFPFFCEGLCKRQFVEQVARSAEEVRVVAVLRRDDDGADAGDADIGEDLVDMAHDIIGEARTLADRAAEHENLGVERILEGVDGDGRDGCACQ